ncbi:MAG: carbohydrate transporter rane protein 2, family [Thermomicrobiales bacterium]|nr:carbohydrate transporter rane protein 2, family [Thermomicrobiales bacterium]
MTHALQKTLIYAVLTVWTFVCLFPIYWTVTTAFKEAKDIFDGGLVPWVQFEPNWKGWEALGLSPDTIGRPSSARELFLKHTANTVTISLSAATLATVIGSLAAYGLARFAYRFGPWRNNDISFWFLSQLILPPVAIALPVLVLYRELDLLDTRTGLILVYTIMNLPIVIWIMRDQFMSIPVELEQAALVDGASIWQAFLRIVAPIAAPGFVAAFILSLVFSWNEYFFAVVLTGADAPTLPLLLAGQTGSQGTRWWSIAALATAAITPLVIIGLIMDRHIVRGLTAGAVK